MEKVNYDDLPESVGDQYELVILAAKRAQALADGARPLVDNVHKQKYIDIALKEIKEGKIVNAGGAKGKTEK